MYAKKGDLHSIGNCQGETYRNSSTRKQFDVLKVCMVCLCMWWDGEGRANAKVIHVPATVCQRPGVTRREKKSDGDSDFSTFLPSSRC